MVKMCCYVVGDNNVIKITGEGGDKNMKKNIYQAGLRLGLKKRDIDKIVREPAAIYKSGIQYGVVKPSELYKSGIQYGVVKPIDLYKSGIQYGVISAEDF